LDYNYFRDYDPKLGRYIESDPIGLNGEINTCGYVSASPIAYSDAKGLCLEDLCIGEAIVAATWCAANPACRTGVATIVSSKQAHQESHDAYKAFQRQGYQRDPNDPCQELRNKIEFHEK
jgi:uncharacterized protein RhaS with RHS repeats